MKKGDVCIVNLAVEVGHEQYGKKATHFNFRYKNWNCNCSAWLLELLG